MELEPQLPPELKDAGVNFELIEAESAADLTQDQINEQMRKYNLQPSGSHTDNIQKLQEKFDEEYEKIRAAREDYVEKRRKFDEARKKRAMLEKEHVEEMEALSVAPKLEVWYNKAQDNATPTDASLRQLNMITCRAVSRVLHQNTSLLALDVSHNGLDDVAGMHLAEMITTNRRLVKFEAECNNFGALSCAAFGKALKINSTLTYVSFENNPLGSSSSEDGRTRADMSGVQALAEMLEVNSSLTALNLFCTSLRKDGGELIANGLQGNGTAIILDVGDNGVARQEMALITDQLEANRKQRDLSDQVRREQRAESQRVANERRAQLDAERKAKQLEDWHTDQARLRSEARQLEMEEGRERRAKEEEEMRQKAEEEKKRREEEESKGKKKKKKGKKKK